MLRIRPHHIVCLRLFEGRGYDEAFTARMREVYDLMKAKPETRFTLVSGADDLCAACPFGGGAAPRRYHPPIRLVHKKYYLPPRTVAGRSPRLQYSIKLSKKTAEACGRNTAPQTDSHSARRINRPGGSKPTADSGMIESPHIAGMACALGEEDVRNRDENALKALGLAAGERVSFAEAVEKIAGRMDETAFEAVCGGCRWLGEGVCSFEKLRRAVALCLGE